MPRPELAPLPIETEGTCRVFVAEPNSRYNLDDARRYGSIVYLDTRQEQSIFDTEKFLDRVYDRLGELGFDPQIDRFCLAGHVVTVGLVLAALTARYAKVKTLMYDARASVYIEREVWPRY